MIDYAMNRILDGKDLSAEEMGEVFEMIMSGQLSAIKTSGFLTALRAKGESPEEILGAARVMRSKVSRINHNYPLVFDNCGTGGDGANTFNISTTAAFVIAACDVKVAKHGNRAVSSKSGSADVLQALGVNIEIDESGMQACLERVGIGFLFAPKLHPAMKAVVPIRKELGIRTIFNILGPLTNPAFASHQLIGVFNESYVEKLADAAHRLGLERVGVVYNRNGIDEFTTAGENVFCFCDEKGRHKQIVIAGDYGFEEPEISELKGGSAEENAEITKNLLEGENGPKHDTVLLNAAVGLMIAGSVESIDEGIARAGDAIDSGQANMKLQELISVSNEATDAKRNNSAQKKAI